MFERIADNHILFTILPFTIYYLIAGLYGLIV